MMDDNTEVLRQQTFRRPPRVATLRGTFRKIWCVADATAVVRWAQHHRDHNRTANGFMCLAHTTEQSVEWSAANSTVHNEVGIHYKEDMAQQIAARESPTSSEGTEGPL
ncbi:hypothetical protein PF005_g3050 [Phytophthora fragariae]|uniref:Uncharacterized protein n=1 Tax=Phytophthora fragariae TaxID=53985 RepID=A0A6A3M7Q4_9STRA|nr:hypothetical protein PF011_g2477 [Phytophthora fragariae]KAE9231585.1 hypothetical protein PF005_g3050 [Phytophthora fragariae]KAE9253144.1 hypothetical protein PF002_g3491 [Phytophthora fragariae]